MILAKKYHHCIRKRGPTQKITANTKEYGNFLLKVKVETNYRLRTITKKFKKIGSVESMTLLEKQIRIQCHIEEPSKLKKVLMKLLNVEGVAKVTPIERDQVDMKSSVPDEYCFESKEIHKITRQRRTPR